MRVLLSNDEIRLVNLWLKSKYIGMCTVKASRHRVDNKHPHCFLLVTGLILKGKIIRMKTGWVKKWFLGIQCLK